MHKKKINNINEAYGNEIFDSPELNFSDEFKEIILDDLNNFEGLNKA
ncbi:hypothetical protein PAF15_00885 [Weissella koreensis]|nr:hypothetical protein [Weissella koreensis]AEJ23089.1 hypothetical protein WKK_01065 [Weissella koreensis KACC 15510]EJF33899.1 hypothetical protein JC2156_04550 [Weissella koreensis KCTC 3621]EJF34043.1 hypothetical protein JC2156_03510 [Weissella koreensis KCTC 3621]MCZ9310533.1 hypothetical protein [Weissella koreensis]